MHEHVADPPGPEAEPARPAVAAPVVARAPADVLRLQRQIGNRAVGRVLARKLAPAFVNTAQSIADYYNGKGAPDASLLKQATDLQAEIDKLVEEEVKVRDEIDAVSTTGAAPPADKLKRLYELRGAVFGKLMAQGSALSHLQEAVPADPAPDPAVKQKPVQPDEEQKLWSDVARNPLEASVAHALKIWRWVLQWQVDELTTQIAGTAPDDTQKLDELKKKRKEIVTELRTGVYAPGQAGRGGVRDIKQWRGPWASRNYLDEHGKTSWDYDSGHIALIQSSACGPTSLAIILDYLSQGDPEGLLQRKEDLTGEDFMEWVLKYAESAGAHSVIGHAKDEKWSHGAESSGTSGPTMVAKLRGKLGSLRAIACTGDKDAKEHLDQGHLLICLTHNHFVVIDDWRDPPKGTVARTDWHVMEVGDKWGSSGWSSNWSTDKQKKVGWGQMWAFWGGY